MVRQYISGPGKPTIADGFAKTESSWPWLLKRRQRFRRSWFAAVDEIVAERKSGPAADHPTDLLTLLLAAHDPETGSPLSDAEVRDQCATMLFAGYETTSRLLFWATYLLCLDQSEQSRVRAEIMAFQPSRVSTLDDALNWSRLRQTLLGSAAPLPARAAHRARCHRRRYSAG